MNDNTHTHTMYAALNLFAECHADYWTYGVMDVLYWCQNQGLLSSVEVLDLMVWYNGNQRRKEG